MSQAEMRKDLPSPVKDMPASATLAHLCTLIYEQPYKSPAGPRRHLGAALSNKWNRLTVCGHKCRHAYPRNISSHGG